MGRILGMKDLVVGVFDPGEEMLRSILGLLDADKVNVPLRTTSKDKSISLINNSRLPCLHGAFIGEFSDEDNAMRDVVEAIQSKYPHAWTVAMVESKKISTGADEKVNYWDFSTRFDSILSRMLANANRPVRTEYL